MNYSGPILPVASPITEDGMTLPIKGAAIKGSALLNGDQILTVNILNKTWQEWGETLTEKIQSIVRGGAAPPAVIPGETNLDHNKVMLVIREARNVDVFGVEDGTVSVFDPAGLTFPDGTPCTRAHVKMVGFNRKTIRKRFLKYGFSSYTDIHGNTRYVYLFGEFRANIVGIPGGYARAEYYTRHTYEQWDVNVEIPQWNEYGEVIPPLVIPKWNYQGAEFEYFVEGQVKYGDYYNAAALFPVALDPDDEWPYHFMDDYAPASKIPDIDKPDYLKQPDTFRAFEEPETGPKPTFVFGQLCTKHFPLLCWAILVNE